MCDRAFNVASNPNNEYHWGLASMVYKSFDKKYSSSNTLGGAMKTETILNQHIAKE